MKTYVAAFLIALVACLLLTPLVRWAAFRFGLVDDGSESRKVHSTPIPRLGGVAIAISYFLPVFGLIFLDNLASTAYYQDSLRVLGLVGGAAAVVLVGVLDDLFGLRALVKLGLQVAIALAVCWCGFQIHTIATPFGTFPLLYFSIPVTVFWIVGVMNAMNLIDGLDGLAGGVALFAVVTLFILAMFNNNVVIAMSAASLAGALLGFLRYNFNPASIFMGDSGSLFLGFVLSTTAIWGSAKSSTAVALMIPVLALGLPLFDTTLAIVRRFLGGKGIFSADRGHVHHRLLDLGLTHRQVVLVLYGVCFVFTVMALTMVYANERIGAVVMGIFLVAVLVFAWVMGFLNFANLNQTVRYGLIRQQRGLKHLNRIDEAVVDLEECGTFDQVVAVLAAFGQDADLDGIELTAAVQVSGRMQAVEFDWASDEGIEWGRGINGPAYHLAHDLRWSLGMTEIVGKLTFSWHCDEKVLVVPEAPGYRLLALVVRDRLLEIAVAQSQVRLGPRLVKPSTDR